MTKTTIKQSGRYKAIVYTYIFLSTLLLAGAVVLGLPFYFPADLLMLYLVQVFVGAIGVIAYFKAVEYGKVSILAPLSNLFVLLVMVIGVVFLSESISAMQLVGVLIIICAALVIAFASMKKLEFEKGVLYLGVAILCWGYYYSFIKIFVTSLGAYMATLFIELGIMVVIIAYYVARKRDLSPQPVKQAKPIFFRSVLAYIGAVTYNISVLGIGVALTAGVAAAQPILDVVFSHIVLKERLDLSKYVAVVLMVIGLLVLFLAG